MIVDAWWMNIIAIVLIIILFICLLVLYLHMNSNQQKEQRNVALLTTGSVMFALVLVILVADVIVEFSKDTKKENKLKERSINNEPSNKIDTSKYGAPRK